MKHWRIDDVAWDRFDPTRVDPDIVPLVKAAAMVERNGADYGLYLSGVFPDDPDFPGAAADWAAEEVAARRRAGHWAMLADPPWDYEAAFARYRAGYRDRHRRRRLDPRLAHRRADRPLHGRDRHVELLHRTRRGDGGAGAASDLPADRRRRIPPLQAVLRPHAPLPGAREHRRAAPPAHRRRPGGREPRTTSWPSPFTAATSPRARLTRTTAASPPTWGGRWRYTASAISSAAWA